MSSMVPLRLNSASSPVANLGRRQSYGQMLTRESEADVHCRLQEIQEALQRASSVEAASAQRDTRIEAELEHCRRLVHLLADTQEGLARQIGDLRSAADVARESMEVAWRRHLHELETRVHETSGDASRAAVEVSAGVARLAKLEERLLRVENAHAASFASNQQASKFAEQYFEDARLAASQQFARLHDDFMASASAKDREVKTKLEQFVEALEQIRRQRQETATAVETVRTRSEDALGELRSLVRILSNDVVGLREQLQAASAPFEAKLEAKCSELGSVLCKRVVEARTAASEEVHRRVERLEATFVAQCQAFVRQEYCDSRLSELRELVAASKVAEDGRYKELRVLLHAEEDRSNEFRESVREGLLAAKTYAQERDERLSGKMSGLAHEVCDLRDTQATIIADLKGVQTWMSGELQNSRVFIEESSRECRQILDTRLAEISKTISGTEDQLKAQLHLRCAEISQRVEHHGQNADVHHRHVSDVSDRMDRMDRQIESSRDLLSSLQTRLADVANDQRAVFAEERHSIQQAITTESTRLEKEFLRLLVEAQREAERERGRGETFVAQRLEDLARTVRRELVEGAQRCDVAAAAALEREGVKWHTELEECRLFLTQVAAQHSDASERRLRESAASDALAFATATEQLRKSVDEMWAQQARCDQHLREMREDLKNHGLRFDTGLQQHVSTIEDMQRMLLERHGQFRAEISDIAARIAKVSSQQQLTAKDAMARHRELEQAVTVAQATAHSVENSTSAIRSEVLAARHELQATHAEMVRVVRDHDTVNERARLHEEQVARCQGRLEDFETLISKARITGFVSEHLDSTLKTVIAQELRTFQQDKMDNIEFKIDRCMQWLHVVSAKLGSDFQLGPLVSEQAYRDPHFDMSPRLQLESRRPHSQSRPMSSRIHVSRSMTPSSQRCR